MYGVCVIMYLSFEIVTSMDNTCLTLPYTVIIFFAVRIIQIFPRRSTAQQLQL